LKDFYDSVNASKCKLNSDPEEPLEITWYKKNDFDEEEAITLYACLATDKTFVSRDRIVKHFNKDKKAFTEHKKEMKKLFADIDKKNKKQREQLANHPVIKKWNKMLVDNDPEVSRTYWRNILWYVGSAKRVIHRAKQLYPHPEHHSMYMQWETYNAHLGTLAMWIEQFEEKLAGVTALLEAKCLNHTTLQPYFLYFEKYVTHLLRHLVDTNTEFMELYHYSSPECVRINPIMYTDNHFLYASDNMPTVDF
jgi:hypothetical protein